MDIGHVTGYGIFDTSVKFPKLKKTTDRVVSDFEFEYIISSTATAVIDGSRYILQPNTFLLRKPMQVCSSFLHFKCFYLHLAMPADCKYYNMLIHSPNYFQIIDHEKYKSILEELVSHMQTENETQSDFVFAKFLELFYFIRRDSSKNIRYAQRYPKNDEPFIMDSLHFMQEFYGEKITLKTLADKAGYSPNYFHRIFTEIMDITPQNYLLQIRLNNAKKLLINTKKTIAEIAAECGFASQSHLTAQFKKAVQLTPYEYRKLNITKYLFEE